MVPVYPVHCPSSGTKNIHGFVSVVTLASYGNSNVSQRYMVKNNKICYN